MIPNARLCKALGYTVIGMDSAIEREAKQRKAAAAADSATKKTQP